MSPGMPLPFLKPETIEAIKNDQFAMSALEVTREFLMVAHRDFSRVTKEGKMIFTNDEAGIVWAALGELMGAKYKESDLPSDTTVSTNGVCMNIGGIDMIQKAISDGARKRGDQD